MPFAYHLHRVDHRAVGGCEERYEGGSVNLDEGHESGAGLRDHRGGIMLFYVLEIRFDGKLGAEAYVEERDDPE